MRHKSFDLMDIKADGDKGEFSALVAVFANVDRQGDRIMPGAFTKSLQKWVASGDPIPIILSHQWADPMAHIGIVDPKNVKQTPKGLMFTKAKLDIADNAVAAQVYKLMKRRSLKEFSIGYGVPRGGESVAEDGANELSEIDLFEGGPTLKGANPETELVAVKSALGVTDPPPPEPASEADLRRQTAALDREKTAERLAELPTPDAVHALTEQLEAANARLLSSTEQLEAATAALREPRSEKDLRKATDQLDREAAGLPETDVEPAPDPLAEAHAELAAAKAEVEELKAQLDAIPEAPAASEAELRKATDLLEREEVKAQLPNTSGVEPGLSPLEQLQARVASNEAELAALKGTTPPAPVASEADLRRETDRVRRAEVKAQLPDTGAVEPGPSPMERAEARLAATEAELAELKATVAAAAAPPPASEDELRRQTERVRRAEAKAQLPATPGVEPAPPPLEVLRTELTERLESLTAAIEAHQKGAPPSEADLRRRTERVERERITGDLPDTNAEPAPDRLDRMRAEVTAELKAINERIAAQPAAPAPTEAEQRRAADQNERDRQKARLPKTDVEPGPHPFQEMLDRFDEAMAEVRALSDKLAKQAAPEPASPASEAELRRRDDARTRQAIADGLPATDVVPAPSPAEKLQAELDSAKAEARRREALFAAGKVFATKRLASDLRSQLDAAGSERFGNTNTYAYVDDFDPDEGWVVYYVCSETNGDRRFVQVEYTVASDGSVTLGTDEVEVVRTTAYRPVNGQKAERRPIDPLRQRSDQAVLEIQSDGASLRKPPRVKRAAKQEPPDEADLRRRSREVMLQTLTGKDAR